MEIIPAIMPKNYEDLKNKIALVRGLVDVVQVDLMDGVFTHGKTWPFFAKATQGTPFLDNSLDEHFTRILNEQEGMPFWEDIEYEFDLMINRAHDNFDNFLKLGAKRIIFHIEAEGDLIEFRDFLEAIDLYIREHTRIGIAINIDTPIEDLKILVPHIDFIQCMGIAQIGKQGEPFDERVQEKIKTLKSLYPELTMSVDGGIDIEMAEKLIDIGVDRLAIGSAIFANSDISQTIQNFKNLE